MDKRIMAKTGERVSRLGMGVMRMPQTDGKIDYAHSEAMIDRLMESGVTYYDTAYFYHDGLSEEFVKKALIQRHPRERYTIATKLPVSMLKDNSDCERIFNIQKERLGTDMFDFYLLHGIGLGGWQKSKEVGADEFQRKLKKEGRIRYAGFSFHGQAAELAPILEENDWDFVQLQINYFDWLSGDAAQIYEMARKKGIGIVVMEPVRGGALAKCHPSVMDIFKKANPNVSMASYALRWVASLPAVDVILSGMSDSAQVEDNLKTFSPVVPVSDAERPLFDEAISRFNELPLIGCTDCRYCKDCPQTIEIYRLFSSYNDHVRFGYSWTLDTYNTNMPAERRVTNCVECGQCESVCPQGLGIIEELKKVHELAINYER